MRNPRDLLKPSLNLRRTTFAFAFAGLTLLLLGGVLGAALAQDPSYVRSAQLPATFGLPSPHVGDRAAYNQTEVNADGTITAVGNERPVAFFEWLPPHQARNKAGQLRLVNELHLVMHRTDRNGAIVTSQSAFMFDAFDGATVAYGDVDHNATLPPCDRTRYSCPTSREIALKNVAFTEGVIGGFMPCLVSNSLQGKVASIADEQPLFSNCYYFDYWSRYPMVFKAVAAEATPEGTEVVWELNHAFFESAPPMVRAWTREGLPYPSKMVVEEQNHPGVFLVFRLVGFQRGAAPLASGIVPDAPRLPPATLAARQPWGMDEAGILHPFPLSRAYEFARTDPNNSTLRDFLTAHPDSYTGRAEYSEFHNPQYGLERSWMFRVTDGTHTDVVCVSQVTTGKASLVPGGLPVADPTNETKLEYRACYQPPAAYPPLRSVPSQMPTVASLERLWTSYASDEYRTDSPNAWGFEIWCGDVACKSVVSRFSAGTNHFDFQYGTGLPGDSGVDRRYAVSRLSVEADGRPQSLMEYSYRDTYGSTSSGGVATAKDTSPALPSVHTGGWIAPVGVYAATVGLAAVLVGIGYWIWPSLKGAVGFGLFSRIDRPMVLEQPVRAEIAALVEAEPGIHFSEIARRLDLGQGSVTHHLRKLVETGVLTVQSTDAYTCYFPKGRLDRRVMAAMPHVRAETARQILREAASQPGVNLSQLARKLGVARQTIHEHVGRLTAAGLLATEPSGRSLKLSVTTLGIQTLNT